MNPQSGQVDADALTRVKVKNIGGIESANVSFSPGVTVLSGRNATNRTSFLRAIMAGLGSKQKPLKSDEDEGSVEISIGDRTFSRSYKRATNGIVSEGSPYLDDPTVADLFAFLLSDNEARRAAERENNLRDILLRPINTEEIEAEIRRLQDEREEIDQEISEIDNLRQTKSDLQEELHHINDNVTEVEDRLENIGKPEKNVQDHEGQEELDSFLDELEEKRSELNNTRFELTTERESLEQLQSERDELQQQLSKVSDVAESRVESLDQQIRDLRLRRKNIENEINQLSTVIEFNQDILDGHSELVVDAKTNPTDALTDDETVTCWTCGSSVGVDAIERNLELLEDRRREKMEKRSTIEEEIDELKEELSSIREKRDRKQELAEELASVKTQISDHRSLVNDLEAQQNKAANRVEQLEERIDDLENQALEEFATKQQEVSELEFERERLNQERERLKNNIEELDDQIARRDELQSRREQISNQLNELRTRVQQLESDAIDAFNEHMEEILELLHYENIERVWIERKHGSRDSDVVFALNIVRSKDDGTAYTDTIDHLSESEREVIGLVFALSGYLVHDVHERLPFILLDSLEVIDSDRIANLVDYFSTYSENLVVALLPEDAEAIADEAELITSIG